MAKSSNKWLERYTDGGLYIPLEGTSYVVRQQISKPRTYGNGGKYLTVNGEYHRVYENAEGDIMVNHPKEDKGKWDTINLTQKAKAKTIAQGIAATKKWHKENPEYANGGLGDGDDPKKPKTVIYNDYNKYLKAKQAYTDSLNLYNSSKIMYNHLLKNQVLDYDRQVHLYRLLEQSLQKTYPTSNQKKIQPINFNTIRYNDVATGRPGIWHVGKYAKPKVNPKYQEPEEVKSKDESFMFPGVLSYDKKEMTPFAEEDLNFSDYTKTINDLKENESEIKKPNTQIKNNNSSSFKNKIKKLKREFFPGYRLPYQYQSAKVSFFENGGLNDQDPPVESLRSATTYSVTPQSNATYPIIPQNFVPIKWDAKTQKEIELLQKSINERTKNTPEFKQARKLTKEEQDYSDKVKARIKNPSADLGILAANMASALTRLQYLTPDEIKKITNNPKATTELAADILGQGLTNELIGGAVTVAPQAIKSVGKYLTEGPLKNTSKLNPWAYQYNLPKNVMWRGLGQEGMEDAINSGVFRSKQNVIPEYYPGKKLRANKSFGTNPYFTPNFNTAANYGDNFIAEVPKDVVNWKNRYGKGKTWSQIANKPIPIEQGRILQKHWLEGYKPIKVSKPTFSKSVENIFSSKEKPLKDWMIEEMRFANLPELNNPNASEVLENFIKRISTPEGQKRLKKLGITETDVFDKLKIVADKNTLGRYWLNKIGLHPELPEVRRVTRHEIEHGVQDAYIKSKLKQANKFKFFDLFGSNEKSKRIYKALNDETTSIDKSLQNLELRKTPQDVDWKLLKETTGKQDPSNLFNYMSDKQRATNYFASGSKGREKSAFLSEVQQYMMDQGIIPKTSYIEITPEMVKNTFIDAMFDEKGGGKYLRLFNIMKPTKANYKLISENLNKMLGLVPAGIVGAAALQQKENGGWLNQYEQGGYADDSAVLNSEGQEVNTMQFALPTVPTFNFGNGNGNGNGDGDGEDPKDKKKSKDKKTDTRTIGQKRHDALEAAKTKILKTESPENKKKMDMLYSTTMAAENTYGYDPKAYGRKKQTRSPMSIDNIALDELFNPKGEKNRYTLQQKSNFDLLRSLGLPTDKAKLKELLETDDAYAGLGVAKTLYYNEGALKNLPNPTDTAAYINLYLDEYNKKGALKYQKRNELIDNITNKMRAQGKRETKTIKPVVKNKTTK